MRKSVHLIILYSLLALAGCSSGGSADWKDLREQANDYPLAIGHAKAVDNRLEPL